MDQTPYRSADGPDVERRATKANGSSAVTGIPLRQDDIEPARGLHWVAVLFRVMAGLLVVLMVLQVTSGLTGTVAISYGVLLAEAIQLIIFAGLLWGGGDLADLFVKSHHDLRATRILLGRLVLPPDRPPVAPGEPRVAQSPAARGRGDGVH